LKFKKNRILKVKKSEKLKILILTKPKMIISKVGKFETKIDVITLQKISMILNSEKNLLNF